MDTTEIGEVERNLTAATLVGLTIALVLTTVVWYPPLLGPLLPDGFVLCNLTQQGIDWAFTFTLVAIVLFWERLPLSSMGFKKLTGANVSGGLGLGGFVMVGLVVWTLAFGWLRDPSMGMGPPSGFYVWFGPLALVTAGVCEEVIYRGYAMERLLRMFKSPWPALLLPHAAFSLMHIKDGWEKVLMVATVGFLFTWWYYKSRDLTMNIVGHLFVDAMALVGAAVGLGVGD
ncbi:MAG: type II CAAX endopeptidase family protein [Planctomycetota bacterium]